MLSAFKKKIASKIFKTDAPAKEKLPFDLRLGSHLSFSTNKAIIYGALCDKPVENTVTAIGRFTVAGAKGYRFYVSDDYFLQVLVGGGGEMEEIRLFHEIEQVFPTDSSVWGQWLGDTAIIGAREHTVQGREFLRVESWADDDADYAPRISIQEDVKCIRLGEYTKYHELMLYGRWLSEETYEAEYLLLSSEERSFTGATSEDLITKSVGIDIDANEVVSDF